MKKGIKKTAEKKFWSWFILHSNEYLKISRDNYEHLLKELDNQLFKVNENLLYSLSLNLHPLSKIDKYKNKK
jgi:hypothetical protein